MGHRLEINRCEFCGTELPTRARTGRPRRYCRSSCRSAARRARREALAAELPPPSDAGERDLVEAFLVGRCATPDDQVLAAVEETLLLVIAYRRLGAEARGQFAWRCAGMAEALEAALHQYFREVAP
jgi:hypothetical protein